MMNKLCVVLLLLVAAWLSPVTATTFSELRGMEDTAGNTHLFYRLHEAGGDTVMGWYWESNHVYHWDLSSGADTLMIADYFEDFYPVYVSGQEVTDYECWPGDPARYVYCGLGITMYETSPFISLWNQENVFTSWAGMIETVEISRQNPALLLADFDTYLLLSNDSGQNWQFDSTAAPGYQMLKMSPFDDQVLFAVRQGQPGLWKSADRGQSYQRVDSSQVWHWHSSRFVFDSDSGHIFARTYGSGQTHLLRSVDAGDSWQWLRSDSGKVHLCGDTDVSGRLFRSVEADIFESSDYGATFNLYQTLDRPVIGLYKKPGSGSLFAATKTDILVVTPAGARSIKNLVTGIRLPEPPLAETPVLYPNYPNPFNNETVISYRLAEAGKVELAIFNLLGQRVRTLFSEWQPAGEHRIRWDGRDDSGREVASGVYIYRLTYSSLGRGDRGLVQTCKMLLLR